MTEGERRGLPSWIARDSRHSSERMRINRLSSVFAWTVGVWLWVTVSLAMGQATYEAPMTVSMSLNSRDARTGGLLKVFTEREMLSEIGAVGRTVLPVS